MQYLTLSLYKENNLTLVVVTHAIDEAVINGMGYNNKCKIVTHAIDEAVILGKKILLLDTPPISTPKVFDNPSAGAADHRESNEYQELCNLLRREMQHEAE